MRSIRVAAIARIYLHGFEAMNLRDLAADVNLRVGSLYNYVPTIFITRSSYTRIRRAWLRRPLPRYHVHTPVSVDSMANVVTRTSSRVQTPLFCPATRISCK